MKYFPLIWSGLWRKKGRTVLNLISILVAFALFGVLQGMTSLFGQSGSDLKADRMIVVNRAGGLLPISYVDRIANLPHVRSVNFRNLFVGVYQHPPQFAVGFGVDPRRFFLATPEYHAAPQAIADLVRERQGALVSVQLMQKYGWKIGDRIALKNLRDTASGDGKGNWNFDIAGTFTISGNQPGLGPFVFNNDYYDQGRVANKGTVSTIDITTDNANLAAPIANSIDALFANSPYETRTQPAYATVQDALKQLGDVDYIAHAVLGVVFFALLVSVGTVMMRGVRDRTPELAVLKTIGFTDRAVALMLIAEILLLTVVGAGLGISITYGLMPPILKTINLNFGGLPAAVLLEACLVAAVFALAVGLWPARRAMRLEIVAAIGGN